MSDYLRRQAMSDTRLYEGHRQTVSQMLESRVAEEERSLFSSMLGLDEPLPVMSVRGAVHTSARDIPRIR